MVLPDLTLFNVLQFSLSFFVIGLGIMQYLSIKGDKLDVEHGQVELFKDVCRVKIHTSGTDRTLDMRLSIYKEFVVLVGLEDHYIFDRKLITSVQLTGSFGSQNHLDFIANRDGKTIQVSAKPSSKNLKKGFDLLSQVEPL